MAVKIKLKRLGKIRNPQYRIVIADSRTKRDGRAIEEVGIYHPKEDPSLIQVDSDRVQYWLGVGAQPTEPVMRLLQITGDWQKFKGEPGAEGTLKVAESRRDKGEIFAAAVTEAAAIKDNPPPKPVLAPAGAAAEAEEIAADAAAEDAVAEDAAAEGAVAESDVEIAEEAAEAEVVAEAEEIAEDADAAEVAAADEAVAEAEAVVEAAEAAAGDDSEES